MKILVINADCLTRNSSANLCHLAYIRGLIEAGHDVSVLSADGRDYILDANMQIPDGVHNYTVYGVSIYEKLSLASHRNQSDTSASDNVVSDNANDTAKKQSVVAKVKGIVRSAYGPHGIYVTFVRKASHFSLKEEFDVLLSISTPPASHLLAYKLLKKKKIHANRWIQIWEDPWYSDVYGFSSSSSIYKEEKRLLAAAQYICYVSPLTLKKQKELFPESAKKMYWQPLPSYYVNATGVVTQKENSYGYFGDYAPEARDLEPFYLAAKKTGISVNICGNPFGLFASTEKVCIHPRLPLNKLRPIEDKTNVLVFLCNRGGGQIPGKIYQYSATAKTILFILDGSESEKTVLKEYFEKFNRYIFCENKVEDITRAIYEIEENLNTNVNNQPLMCFEPKAIVEKILCIDED